jgi:hypothetical protein
MTIGDAISREVNAENIIKTTTKSYHSHTYRSRLPAGAREQRRKGDAWWAGMNLMDSSFQPTNNMMAILW